MAILSCVHILFIQMLMNASVEVMTVAMGLVLTYQALILVSALLATSSTLIANNVLVKINYYYIYYLAINFVVIMATNVVYRLVRIQLFMHGWNHTYADRYH